MVGRYEALVAEVHVDGRPVDRCVTQRAVALLGRLAARERDRGWSSCATRSRERVGDVVDDLHGARKRHVCHSSRSWTGKPSTCTRRARRSGWCTGDGRRPTPSRSSRRGYRRERRGSISAAVRVGTPPSLGTPVVASDAARAMLDLVGEHAPGAGRVVADLEALPFAPGALGGIWAHKCYMHVAAQALPLALADAHRALQVGGALHVQVTSDRKQENVDDRFPGRHFEWWPADRLHDVVVGAGFEIDAFLDDGEEWLDVEATRARTLADTVGPGHAPAGRRAEPERVLGRRRSRLRPARQPLLARRPRGGNRHARARPATRAPGRRRRHDRPGEAGNATRRRAHTRRVPHRHRARRATWCNGSRRARCASSG